MVLISWGWNRGEGPDLPWEAFTPRHRIDRPNRRTTVEVRCRRCVSRILGPRRSRVPGQAPVQATPRSNRERHPKRCRMTNLSSTTLRHCTWSVHANDRPPGSHEGSPVVAILSRNYKYRNDLPNRVLMQAPSGLPWRLGKYRRVSPSSV